MARKVSRWWLGAIMLLLLLSFSLLISLQSVSAVAIGVNKATLNFDDVLRGGYAQEQFIVSTDTDQPIGGVVQVEGDISEWVSFLPEGVEEDGFEFSATQPAQITVVMRPPVDAANGNYSGVIRLLTGEIARSTGGQMGTSTRAAFKITGRIGVTDVENKACVLAGVRLRSTEVDQPIDLLYSISNTGNVRVQPTILVSVFDQLEEQEIFTQPIVTKREILPTTVDDFLAQIAHDLPIGQYWARITSEECSGGGYVTFDVLDRGGILDEGELIRIEAEPWNNVGDIIPITAVFRNKGERTVSAKLKGTIMLGRKLVKVIDTDLYNVPPGAVEHIETFFNPAEPGQYVVAGRVLYNNKLTYERSTIINVNGAAIRGPGNQTVTVIVVLLVVFVLLLLIFKKRKVKRRPRIIRRHR